MGDAGNRRHDRPAGNGSTRTGRSRRPAGRNPVRPGDGGPSATVWRPDVAPPPASPEEEERAGVFRETLAVAGWRLELVARRPVGGSWGAWVRRAAGAGAPEDEERLRGMTAIGPTPADALAALAEAIHAALGDPVRPERPT